VTYYSNEIHAEIGGPESLLKFLIGSIWQGLDVNHHCLLTSISLTLIDWVQKESRGSYSYDMRKTNSLEVKKVALVASSFQHRPSLFGVLVRYARPIHGTIILAVRPSMAFLFAVIADEGRLRWAIFRDVPLLLAVFTGTRFDPRVGAICFSMASLLSVKG
jgi:hypothetical protein